MLFLFRNHWTCHHDWIKFIFFLHVAAVSSLEIRRIRWIPSEFVRCHQRNWTQRFIIHFSIIRILVKSDFNIVVRHLCIPIKINSIRRQWNKLLFHVRDTGRLGERDPTSFFFGPVSLSLSLLVLLVAWLSFSSLSLLFIFRLLSSPRCPRLQPFFLLFPRKKLIPVKLLICF